MQAYRPPPAGLPVFAHRLLRRFQHAVAQPDAAAAATAASDAASAPAAPTPAPAPPSTAEPIPLPSPVVDLNAAPDGVTVISDRRAAAQVVAKLLALPRDAAVAWDTETTGVNPTKESPVHRGTVICATAYAGSHIDFGAGPRLFVDTLEGEPGLLDVFAPYFASAGCRKVWHHYAFDRHVLSNHGLEMRGLAGDTMHMARLDNTALQKYALAELCTRYLDDYEKVTMKERFGRREILKSGKVSKAVNVPPTVDLHRNADTRLSWIDYATADAELTHRLYCVLRHSLQNAKVAGSNSIPALFKRHPNLLSLYEQMFLPFGQLLTDVERTGFRVDVEWLRAMEETAGNDRVRLEENFLEWAANLSPDARFMNINSDQQKLQLFFAPCHKKNVKGKAAAAQKAKKESADDTEPARKTKDETYIPAEKSFTISLEGELKSQYLAELASRTSEADKMRHEKYLSKDKPDKALNVDISLKGLGKKYSELTESGWPSVSAKALRTLAGSPRANPPSFGDPNDKEMCFAIDDMLKANTISTLLSSFIVPLQAWAGESRRIHASLNLNTETGRLSSRRPNLQNQPALEKDQYKIRKAFACEPGNKLIVADYGQLELRLLAHITGCRSMIDAFKAGGDFHSRTALTMFDHVKAAVENGECLLERNPASDDKNIPLLKDMFSSERRKAKTLNFSIAYGKTAKGLAKDWNVDIAEAKETLKLWYKERQEVARWQRNCKDLLAEKGYVETLFGRRRHLPYGDNEFWKRMQCERAAINAPLQGSAADLVTAAMIKLHYNKTLQVLGWKIILQVHDEIILEGPGDSADIALPLVIKEMTNPIDVDLLVDLTVDARCAKSWYDAK